MKILFQKFFFLMFLMLAGCNDQAGTGEQPYERTYPEHKIKEQFVKANQQQLQKETDEINAYVNTHGIPFTATSSGIRYYVYKPSEKGDSIKEGMEITMDYTLSLLNGDVCYSSDKDGSRTFFVGHADMESGIHRGLQYLKTGDKALLIIPSAQAHGLLGDLRKIPPHMPIVYNVKVYD
jgi:FKBP-type peptidyl-prolyl cis-trans isomerase FkpA